MEIIQSDVVRLLKSSITGEKYKLSESFNVNDVLEIAKKHSIVPLIFQGILNCGIDIKHPAIRTISQKYCESIYQHEKQIFELDRIYTAFEENKIDYMPVKGCNMKSLYPSPELRVMGDADILIKREQYPQIEKILKSLGFKFKEEGDHDYTWISENLYLELHYLLIHTHDQAYKEYFGTGWKLAKFHKGHKFSMSLEDEFIYLFIHFTKHYHNGGVGCRHVVDLWVYIRSHNDLDFKYIEGIMKKLKVFKFYKNVLYMIETWFDDKKQDEIAELMTQYIFNSGSWGTLESHSIAKGVAIKQIEGNNRKGKIRILRKAVFPPLESIRYRYNVLEKYPCLLPVMWIWRWIDAFLFRRKNVNIYKKQVEIIMKGDTSTFEYNLKKVGLK